MDQRLLLHKQSAVGHRCSSYGITTRRVRTSYGQDVCERCSTFQYELMDGWTQTDWIGQCKKPCQVMQVLDQSLTSCLREKLYVPSFAMTEEYYQVRGIVFWFMILKKVYSAAQLTSFLLLQVCDRCFMRGMNPPCRKDTAPLKMWCDWSGAIPKYTPFRLFMIHKIKLSQGLWWTVWWKRTFSRI